jgi:hypothetical protein
VLLSSAAVGFTEECNTGVWKFMNLYEGFESYKAETFGAVLSLSSTLQTLLQGARRRLKLTMTRNSGRSLTSDCPRRSVEILLEMNSRAMCSRSWEAVTSRASP